MNEKPHVVLFNVDQWRGDVLGHLGNPGAQTPILDRIVAEEAVSYRWNFCQNPVCVPSRCSFMTGWYPHTRGHRSMRHILHPKDGDPLLLDEMRNAGYHVFWGGKNDLVDNSEGREAHADNVSDYSRYEKLQPNWHGEILRTVRGNPGDDTYFSFYIGKLEKDPGVPYYRDDDWLHVQEAIRQIRERPADKPLCLYLPITYPHPPYAVEEPFYSAIDRNTIPDRIAEADWDRKPAMINALRERQNMKGWSEERWCELRATYYGMCMRIDALLGDLIEALKEEGIWDTTLLTFFSDHGDFTGDYGLVEKNQNTFEDCLSRVPLIIKPPKNSGCQSGVRDTLTELVDVSETIYDYAGIDPAYPRFGKSLRPNLENGEMEHRTEVFCEGGRLPVEPPMDRQPPGRPTKTGSPYFPRTGLQASNDGPYGYKATMCRTHEWKYVHRLGEPDELYDLVNDPGETMNLIYEPSCTNALADMRERLLNWYQNTCDVVPFQYGG